MRNSGRPDALRGALWCHFGVIGGHFGATLESLWSSLGPLYVYECDFKILLRDFQIILIFLTYLMVLYNYGVAKNMKIIDFSFRSHQHFDFFRLKR